MNAADHSTNECWDSHPVACNLREASLGFPSDGRWNVGAPLAISNRDAPVRAKSISSNKFQKFRYECFPPC